MAGIYVHIPFCKQACTYCDFHFSTNQKLRKPLVEAIVQELQIRKDEITLPIRSIYFGGGSPSILLAEEMELITDALSENFDLSELEEFTLESNPDDHSPDKLKMWKANGVDRLSIGIQSFIDRDLELMNRAHSSSEAIRCVQRARDAGFKDLTLDLIYGIPNQSMAEWTQNVETAIALQTDHISAYALTVEPKTVLSHQVSKGNITEKDDEEVENEYRFLHSKLEETGFEHYEISNYAKPGSRAVHNTSYWEGSPYLGVGPAAHSFDGKSSRRWNVSNNPQYIKAVSAGSKFHKEEVLSVRDRINEQIMTGLRTSDGIPKSLLSTSFHGIPAHLKDTLLEKENRFIINPENWLMADAVIRELFRE